MVQHLGVYTTLAEDRSSGYRIHVRQLKTTLCGHTGTQTTYTQPIIFKTNVQVTAFLMENSFSHLPKKDIFFPLLEHKF